MADGAIVTSDNGTIRMTADQNVTLGHVEAATNGATLIAITSRFGGIVDGGDAGTTDVTGSNLVLRAAQGVGSTNSLETRVSHLSIVNTGSGNIQVDNLTGQLLTIDSVDGVSGITNDGDSKGDVVIIPGGTPHWWSEIQADISYVVVRPDPDHIVQNK